MDASVAMDGYSYCCVALDAPRRKFIRRGWTSHQQQGKAMSIECVSPQLETITGRAYAEGWYVIKYIGGVGHVPPTPEGEFLVRWFEDGRAYRCKPADIPNTVFGFGFQATTSFIEDIILCGPISQYNPENGFSYPTPLDLEELTYPVGPDLSGSNTRGDHAS